MQVTATWNEFVTIENQYGAEKVADVDADSHSATFLVTSGPNPGQDAAAFVVMGHGTKAMPTRFSCTAPAAAEMDDDANTPGTAAAPAPDDCDLGAKWVVTNPYPLLTDARLTLDRWETGRVVVLSFAELDINAVNPQHATIRETEIDGRTAITFELASLGNERLCQTGHVNEAGQFVRDTNCVSNNGVQEQLFFSFQLQCPSCIAPARKPQIVCHELSPPPPAPVIVRPTVQPQQRPQTGQAASVDPGTNHAPSSVPIPQSTSPATQIVHASPSPPPLLSPPPPPPQVEATACASGGLAQVQRHVHGANEQETLRIVVSPNHWWPTGYVYVVGMRGIGLRAWKSVCAQPHSAHQT